MADVPPYPEANDDSHVAPEREATPGMAGWQKVVGIIGLIVVLLIVILMLTGGGLGGHTPPAGGH